MRRTGINTIYDLYAVKHKLIPDCYCKTKHKRRGTYVWGDFNYRINFSYTEQDALFVGKVYCELKDPKHKIAEKQIRYQFNLHLKDESWVHGYTS